MHSKERNRKLWDRSRKREFLGRERMGVEDSLRKTVREVVEKVMGRRTGTQGI